MQTLLLALIMNTSLGTTYYVDGITGDNSNGGTSKQTSFRTLEPINKLKLQPGDRILLTSGQTFVGPLVIDSKGKGKQDQPITVTSSSKTPAIIDGKTGDAIRLEESQFVTVENLKVIGGGRKTGNDGSGIRVINTKGITLTKLEVSGFRETGVSLRGDSNSKLTFIHAHNNGGAGIGVNSNNPKTTNLYISDCRTMSNAGDPKVTDNHSGNGIVLGGVDGGIVEYCVASNNGFDMPWLGNGPVGIWVWNSNNVTIQYNISYGNRSPGGDGGGFDIDGGVTNSILQYNLAYNNDGCGYLLCQYPGAAPWKNNICRFNISINDGRKNHSSGIALWDGGGGISNAEVYNNTIVNQDYAITSLSAMKGFAFRNNIFISQKEIFWGDFSNIQFQGNTYWTPAKFALTLEGEPTVTNFHEWQTKFSNETLNGKPTGIFADPKLTIPSINQLPTNPRELKNFKWLIPSSSSVAAKTGANQPGLPKHDFLGKPLPAHPFSGAIAPQK